MHVTVSLCEIDTTVATPAASTGDGFLHSPIIAPPINPDMGVKYATPIVELGDKKNDFDSYDTGMPMETGESSGDLEAFI